MYAYVGVPACMQHKRGFRIFVAGSTGMESSHRVYLPRACTCICSKVCMHTFMSMHTFVCACVHVHSYMLSKCL